MRRRAVAGLLCGVAALLLACCGGASQAQAQGVYGIGGYLERPGENDFSDDSIGARSATDPIAPRSGQDATHHQQRQQRQTRSARHTPAGNVDQNSDEGAAGRESAASRERRRAVRAAPDTQDERPVRQRPQSRTEAAVDREPDMPVPPVPERRMDPSTASKSQSAAAQSGTTYTPAAGNDEAASGAEKPARDEPATVASTTPADTTAATETKTTGDTAATAETKPTSDGTPATDEKSAQSAGSQPATEPAAQAANDDALGGLIGQMLMVGFHGLKPDDPGVQKLAAQIKAGEVGGVVFLNDNVQSPQQVAALAGFLKGAARDTPAFVAIDKEGVLTIGKGFKGFPTALQTGKSISPLDAYTLYKSMASELAESGFNLNLGPVLDLQAKGGDNPRSFGSQPKAVTAFAKAFAVAHHDVGVLTVPRHFPGVVGAKSWDKAALEPYRQLITSGNADAIMTGHAAGAAFSDAPDLPASLSEKTVTKMLRGDLGFTGVAVSGDLETAGKRFSLEERAIRAIKAGNDVLLIGNQKDGAPDLPEKMAAAIRRAVKDGAISRERLQTSHDRIMALKQKLRAAASQAVASAGRNGEKGGGTPAR